MQEAAWLDTLLLATWTVSQPFRLCYLNEQETAWLIHHCLGLELCHTRFWKAVRSAITSRNWDSVTQVLEGHQGVTHRSFLRGCNNPHLPPIKGLTCARWSQHRYRLSQTYLAHLSTASAQLLLQDVAFTTI